MDNETITLKKVNSDRKPLIIQIRGSNEWREWAEEVAAADSRSVSSMVEQAVKHYAKIVGVDRFMPKR